ncbi:MAG: T9SS type A sorting domain-containing protein, partial [Bacteroidota bacterium]
VNVVVPCRESENGSIFANSTEENIFDIKVFPNPSSGNFNFEILRMDSNGENATKEKISISVYDMVGKLVLSESITNSQFVVRNPQLAQGIYSAVIINGENKRVLKLVKTE